MMLNCTISTDSLLRRGYELAEKYNRPTAYDAQYMALAERLACNFWTNDKRLYNAVSGTFGRIRWLGDIQLNNKDDDEPED